MNSGWQPQKQNIILIHGYAGGEETPPVGVLKDGNGVAFVVRTDSVKFALLSAYLNHGDYNVFLVDWGSLSKPPCYVAAVHKYDD